MSGIDDVSVEQALSDRLRELRERAGLSQSQLAVKVGRTQATVSLWESGKRMPTVPDLVVLARELGVEPGEFFGRAAPAAAPDQRRVVLRAEAGRVLRDALVRDVEAFA